MAQTLLAVLLVIACSHVFPELARWRDFSWLRAWLSRWPGNPGDSASAPSRPDKRALVLLPLLLFIVCALIQLALQRVLFGLPMFAFGVIVLFYCWGPRDLERDIEAVMKAPDSARRLAAAQALAAEGSPTPLTWESAAMVEATFAAALSRWFGVLFWFVILGPAGALGYRAVQLIAGSMAADVDAGQRALSQRIALVLDWAPAHLVALTLALVSEFDAVMSTWHDYQAAHGEGYFTLDLGFLGALARAGVHADVVAGDGNASASRDPLVELADARRVLRRILLAWLALIALVAIVGVAR